MVVPLLTPGVALALLAVAGAEGLGRLWIRRFGAYYVQIPWRRIEIAPDPRVLPGMDPLVRFEVNAQGERGRPLPTHAGGLYRVVAAGSSATEGYYLDQPSSWPGALEELLRAPGALTALAAGRPGVRDVYVGNIGTSMVTCGRLAFMLAHLLPRYRPRPDVLIAMLGVADVLAWLEDGCPDRWGRTPTADACFASHPEKPFGIRPRGWALARLIRAGQRRLHHPLRVVAGRGAWYARVRAQRAAAEVLDSSPDPRPLLDAVDEGFRAMVEVARARGVRLLVVAQPWFHKERYQPEEEALFWQGSQGPAWLDGATVYYSTSVMNRLCALVTRRLERLAAEEGVEFLDLEGNVPADTSHFYDFTHFKPPGARLAAAAIARAVLEGAPSPRLAPA